MNNIRLLIAAFSLCFSFEINAQEEVWTKEKATKWFAKSEWSGNLKAKLSDCVNLQEFAVQYHKNKNTWDKVFIYLKNTDLEKLTPGKYTIDGEKAFAIVSEGFSKELLDTKWEFHKKYIDIQYIIRGDERMGIASLAHAVVVEQYVDNKDVGFCTVSDVNSRYVIASPINFLIFFPSDVHRPGIKTDRLAKNKKLVIKIESL